MKRRFGGLAAALVLALFGTTVLVGYVQSAKNKAVAGERLVPVLVVAAPIARGTPAARIAGSVKTVKVPAKVRAQGSVTSLVPLKDLVAAVNLLPGEQVVAERFVTAQAAAQRVDVPKGKLQVTVSLEPQRAVGGQVRVGDTVGVLASFAGGGDPNDAKGTGSETTHLILHKVLVSAVQVEQKVPKQDDKGKAADDGGPTLAPTGNLLVTLALDGPAVERVVFAAEHGTLWLSAEPGEAAEDGTKVVTRGNEY